MKIWARVSACLAVLVATALATVLTVNVVQAASEPKVTICHFPPGNPANVQVITVGASAVASHVALHNDAVCTGGSSNCCFGGSAPSVCTTFATDNNNCGSCGHVCGAGTTCSSGTCVSVCGEGTTFCGCACTHTGVDNDNCGACGNVCAPGTACVGGSCAGVCGPGTTFCGSKCLDTTCDNNNCGACGVKCGTGFVCTGGTCVPACSSGQTLCGTTCVDTTSDNNNCGACGTVCSSPDTCVSGKCTPPAVVESCLPSSSLSVLIQGSKVTAYVPLGSWSETAATNVGVHVVPLEPAGFPSTVATGVVNSCSSNNATGTTVCSGNNNDVYVINGTILSGTAVAHGAPESMTGGTCSTCGVAFDALTGLAWIAEGDAASVGALEAFNPSSSTFGPRYSLFGFRTSEDVSIDPGRSLILSANESNQFQIIRSDTGAVFNAPAPFVAPDAAFGELDSTAEDCKTGVALAPFEFSQSVVFANLQNPTYIAGSPGTWTAPTKVQDFSPDFAGLGAGNSGSAVAPGSHLGIIAGEFGGSAFGLLELPSSLGPGDTPSASDWVAANVPNDPAGVPWQMGRDPHTVTAYVSPSDHKAYAVISNQPRTFLVKVDMAMLLGAPRLAGTHTVDSTTAAYAGSFTFVAQ